MWERKVDYRNLMQMGQAMGVDVNQVIMKQLMDDASTYFTGQVELGKIEREEPSIDEDKRKYLLIRR